MSKQLPSHIGLAALLAACFLAFYGPYGYIIAYQSETNDCFFMFGRPFLLEFLDHPAGVLRYAGRFLSQFYHYQWLGALTVSGCITLFGALFYGVLSKLKKEVRVWQAIAPCVLLAVLHTTTIFLVCDTLGLCASCAAFLGYLWCRGKTSRRVYALAATPILYFALGIYFWMFVVWVAVFERLDRPARSGLLFKIVYAAVSIGSPLFAWRWAYLIPLRSALVCPIMFHPPFRGRLMFYPLTQFVVDCLLAGVLCGWLLVIPFWGGLSPGRRLATGWASWLARRRARVAAVAVCVLLGSLAALRYNTQLSTYVAFRRLYEQRQWDALLEKARRRPSGDLRVQFMTNLALCHKQRLLDEMFAYPQGWGVRGLVFNFTGKRVASADDDDADKAMYNSDLFYEMGNVNVAFIHVYSYMSGMGKTYEALKRMAQCGMAGGNCDLADKYLNMLERTMFHTDFARRYRAIMADPEAMEREFGQLRKLAPKAEGHVRSRPVVPLLMLLEARPDNRMAFDYLTAWFLLEKSGSSMAAVSEAIDRFRLAGYAALPIHCQEALLRFERRRGGAVDLRGFTYDEEIRARVERFIQDMSMSVTGGDGTRRLQTLYGDTYMFYYYFVLTPEESSEVAPTESGFGGSLRQE